MKTKLLFIQKIKSLTFFVFLLITSSSIAQVTISPWKMNKGAGAINFTIPTHGSPNAYSQMNIPETSNSNWTDAPVNANGEIQFSERSILSRCLQQLDFTYFQTFISIPTGYTINDLNVSFSAADDGARAYIFNSNHPNGAYIGEIGLGGTGTSTNYASLSKAGEINKLVIVQFDSCPTGNNLTGAKVNVNGQAAPINTGGCTESNFFWSNAPTVSGQVATGTINGVGYTYTSSRNVRTTTNLFSHSIFPTSYNVPNSNPTIQNIEPSSNTLTFASPMTNPVLVFSSIGGGPISVPINFSAPVEILWSTHVGATPVVQNSPTQITGTEGYAIVRMNGTFSSLSFDYLVYENYVNFVFGADFSTTSPDTVAPTLTLNGNATESINGNSTYTDLGATATDLCDDNPAVLVSGTVNTSVLGNYTLTYTAVDASGNTSTPLTRVVTVIDITPPTLIDVPVNTIVECNVVPTVPIITATDDFTTNPEVSFNEERIDGTSINNYILTRTWTATDESGNTVSKSQIITVQDTSLPTAITKDITVQLDVNGNASITPDMINNGSSDNCGGTLTYVIDKNTFNCNDIDGVSAPNYALNFDSSNAHVNFGSSLFGGISGSAARTFETWVKTTSTGNVSLIHIGLNQATRRFDLRLYNGVIAVDISTGFKVFTTPVNDGEWHHVAVSYTAGTQIGDVVAYIDGVQDTSTGQGNLNYTPNTVSGQATLGLRGNGGNYYPFTGQLDEVRIWNTARTATQIQSNYNQALIGNESGLVAYYNFDEGTGNTVNDLTTNANNGTLTNTNNVTWVQRNTATSGNLVTLTATDSSGNSSTATANVTVLDVLPINTAADQFTLNTCDSFTFSDTDLLSNDTDPYGRTLKVDFVDQPANGTIIDNNNGTYTFTPNSNTSQTFTASYTVKPNDGTTVFTGNGHFYEFISSPGITWTAAKAAAETKDYQGLQGYLVTITSQAENDFAFSKINAAGWIGASDAAVEGDWRWVTGPETGQQFWYGSANGGPVNGAYHAWGGGEPNNAGNEDYAHFRPDSKWNDLPVSYGTYVKGYVVEYGGNNEGCNTQVTATGQISFILNDNIAPTAITKDITVQLDASGNASITPDMIDNGSSDNCGIDTITLDRTSFDCNDFSVSCSGSSISFNGSGIASGANGDNIQNLGLNQLTMEAWVKPYNSSINSIIRKAGDYDLYINNNTLYAEVWYEGRASSAQYLYSGPTVSTNEWSHLAFTFDKANSGSGKFYVNGVETIVSGTTRSIAPDITLGIGGSTEYGQSFTGLIDDVRIWSTDRTSVQINEFKDFCIDANSVGLEAYFKIEANEGTTLTDYSGNGNHLTISGTSWSFEGAPIGSQGTEVTLTVTDNNGNSSTATANVIVLDNIAPTVVGQDISVTLTASGTVSIVPEDVLDNGSDNCGPVNYSISQDTFGATDAISSPVTVQLTGTDASGNSTTVPVLVTVIDPVPVVITQDITVSLDLNGNITITPEQIDNGSNSVVGLATEGGLALDITSFNCANVGTPVTVTLTATSTLGSSASGTAIVTVVDTSAPTAIAKDITVQLDENGNALITPDMVNDGSSDNCEIQSVLFSGSGTINATVLEGNNLVLQAPAGSIINGITFASYVTPNEIDGNYSLGNCHASNSLSIVESYALGQNTVTIQANNGIFGDPCGGTYKRLYVSATYSADSESTKSFDCSNIGNNAVTLLVTDASGNSSTATANVTVVDNIAPEFLTTESAFILLDENGVATYDTASFNRDTVRDNCAIDRLEFDKTVYNCNEIGFHTINVTAFDVNGNSTVGQINLEVREEIFPTVITKDIEIYLDQNGNASITPQDVDNGSFDNCSITLSLDTTEFSCANLGNNTVNLTATDNHGLPTTMQATVRVVDNAAPEFLTTETAFILLDANGVATYDTNGFNMETVRDNCGVDRLEFDKTVYSCDEIGFHTINVTAFDASGNSTMGTVEIEVREETFPTVITKNIDVYLDANGNATITPEMVDNGTFDNCSFTLSLDTTTFSCENVGPNTVNLTATDNHGLPTTQQAIVNVIDNIAPSVSPVNTTITLDSNGNASVDPRDLVNPNEEGDDEEGDCEEEGGCEDVDELKINPKENKGNIQSRIDIGNTLSDACGIQSVISDKVNFTCSDVGNNTVNVTVTDVNGNATTVQVIVTVIDATEPITITQDIQVDLNVNGNVTITREMINNNSTDACGIQSLALDINSFNCSNVGIENIVTLTATDVNGNSSFTTAIVTVNDVTAPNVVTQDVSIDLDANGNATITTDMINNGSSDACGIESYSLDTASFDCSNTGVNEVVLTVTDVNGNSSTKTANVIVNDVTVPTVITQNYSIDLANGSANITPADIDGGTFDNCAFDLTIDKKSFSCEDIGDHVVTLTATDASGNTSSNTAVVSIIGDVPTIAINDFNAVLTQKKNTIFLGYGPQSFNLSTVVTGGSGYTYEWTTSTGEMVSSEASPSISPEVSTTYNVTVTNSNGCTASTSIYVCVIDARAFDKKGRYKGKVVVCHHTNGKKGTKHVTISISQNAVAAHLQHGLGTDHADSLGGCNATCVDYTNTRGNSNLETSILDDMSIYPNPSSGVFDIRLTGVELDTNILLFDPIGKLIERKFISKENSAENIITIGNYNLPSGFYVLKVITKNETVSKKLIISKD